MKIGLALGPGDPDWKLDVELAQRAEALGFYAVWTAETYGADVMTPLAYLAGHTKTIKLGTAIAQLDARPPANLAMCAQTIDKMAGMGRMIVGIGVSGPQIVEGWYGRPWGKPNTRIRDTVAICRKIWAREGPVAHDGKEIALPYRGEGSIGLGKPLRTAFHGSRHIPIWLGTHTPLNVRMTGEIADGWLGFHLVPSQVAEYKQMLQDGLDRRSDGKSMKDFDISGTIGVLLGDDVKAALQGPKQYIALYAGGMGAKDMNFHKEAMIKRGYGEAAQRIQELFLAGRREEATAAVPDEYVDEEYLAGPPARIAERFKAWRDCGMTHLMLRKTSPEIMEILARQVA